MNSGPEHKALVSKGSKTVAAEQELKALLGLGELKGDDGWG